MSEAFEELREVPATRKRGPYKRQSDANCR